LKLAEKSTEKRGKPAWISICEKVMSKLLSRILIARWLSRWQTLVSELDVETETVPTRVAYPSATVPLGNLGKGHRYGLFLIARAGCEDLILQIHECF
jgi:hypothetical protein